MSTTDTYIGAVVADRYRLLKRIGEGGMGVVYLAEHLALRKKFALKMLVGAQLADRSIAQRFLSEAHAASQIVHDNVVNVTDCGELPGGELFLAMEYLEGEDLATLIQRQGPMPIDRARGILLQICRALAAVHHKGIIHRDLKPANVFLTQIDGRRDVVKLLDFGIAKGVAGASVKTTAMTLLGTPDYMAPEQVRGEQVDHRVDIYAVGCTAYEMLTGVPPFRASDLTQLIAQHLFAAPVAPSSRAPQAGIPAALDQVLLKALAKHRDERFATMKALAAALDAALGTDVAIDWGDEASGRYPSGVASRAAAPTVQRSAARRLLPFAFGATLGVVGGLSLLAPAFGRSDTTAHAANVAASVPAPPIELRAPGSLDEVAATAAIASPPVAAPAADEGAGSLPPTALVPSRAGALRSARHAQRVSAARPTPADPQQIGDLKNPF